MKNKTLSLILATVTAVAALSLPTYAKTSYYLGDVDKNGTVNSADALSVLNCAVGKTSTIEMKRADMNKDNKINSADALIILNTAVGATKLVQITEDDPHVAKPIGTVFKTWDINKSNFSAKIERLAYGSQRTIKFTADNKNNYNKQIVNYKTVTYQPYANIAVITPKNGNTVKFSKGTKQSEPHAIAKSIDAEIAINGVPWWGYNELYAPATAATIRDGVIYKSYTGAAGKAETRMVAYKNGEWKKVYNLDNATAKAEVANGALWSIPYMDLTMYDGAITTHFRDKNGKSNETYVRNRTFIGHTYDGKTVFLNTEMMPVSDAAEILKAYNCKDAVLIDGGNSSLMYVKGVGNTTGSKGAQVKDLNKIGYLETELYAKWGLLQDGAGGGQSSTILDVAYIK